MDDQGRVRRMEVTFQDNGQSDVMDLGDFGTRVTVTPPPAGQVERKPGDDPDVKPAKRPDGEAAERPAVPAS
ncbi:hypothetical protein ABGB17_34260 [Sphaerisporangium sp. B11E5]|uniref:hypothetical protein n=1 Tax=Sphaerisporangium sp. B11E5 TaxID=3153563 RepID=UPI00325D68B7